MKETPDNIDMLIVLVKGLMGFVVGAKVGGAFARTKLSAPVAIVFIVVAMTLWAIVMYLIDPR